jgi:hypothetical protein
MSTPYTPPPIPKVVIEWLERVYPNDLRMYEGAEEAAIRMAIGQQKLIARLLLEYNKQQHR